MSTEIARHIMDTEAWERALCYLLANDERTLAEQTALTEIPAPLFGEEARAARMAELMRESGLQHVALDAAGNVLGWHGAPGPGPVVLAAHLDTVFPAGTDVRVRRSGDRLKAPGISDDGRGLAAILAATRALDAAGVTPRHPLLLAATVGEEGAGNLRGVRHLFGPEGAATSATAFISLDGAGTRRIVSRAVGSRRLEVRVRGPGGHSWTDWGTANPLHALSSAVAAFQALQLPADATLSVGRMVGGTSVNAIPEEARMEMEIRSRSETALDGLEPRVRELLDQHVAAANATRKDGTTPLALTVESLGNRPAGNGPPDAPLVRAALAATEALGWTPRTAASSTDANVPISLGIQSVTLGAGGKAGLAHTLEEWYENTGGPEGIARAVLTLMVLDALLREESAP